MYSLGIQSCIALVPFASCLMLMTVSTRCMSDAECHNPVALFHMSGSYIFSMKLMDEATDAGGNEI